jgi:hypothetical protein
VKQIAEKATADMSDWIRLQHCNFQDDASDIFTAAERKME